MTRSKALSIKLIKPIGEKTTVSYVLNIPSGAGNDMNGNIWNDSFFELRIKKGVIYFSYTDWRWHSLELNNVQDQTQITHER